MNSVCKRILNAQGDAKMKQEHQVLLALIRQSVTGEITVLPPQTDWEKVVSLAREHVLGAMAYTALSAHTQVPEATMQALSADYQFAIFRDAQTEHWHKVLQQKLCDAEIPHIFLRGVCLKQDYPIPALRTMTDMDVLVHTQDLDRIATVMQTLQAEALDGDGNHNNYKLPGDVKVEFHPNLIHGGNPVAAGINPGWQYATETESWSQALTEEGFYLNTICHMAEHFTDGGAGIRFVLDVWVCRNLRKTQPDRSFIEQELKRFGLLEFAQNIEALAEAWFGNGQLTPVLQELGDYILSSGIHGKSDRALLNAAVFSGSGVSAFLKRLHYPRHALEVRFPWVRGRPYLLPLAWCARVLRGLRNNRKMAASWGKGAFSFSQEQVNTRRETFRRFGITIDKP